MNAWLSLGGGLVFAVSIQASAAQACFEIVCGQDNYCVASPARLTAKLPEGFEIKSIRGGTKVTAKGDVDIQNCQKVKQLPNAVSLDQGSMYGAVEITGVLRSSGSLVYDQTHEGGGLAFVPNKETFANTGQFYSENFFSVKLDQVRPTVKLRLPKGLEKANCWTASAQVEASNFSVLVGASSEAGAYARNIKITSATNFKKCKPS